MQTFMKQTLTNAPSHPPDAVDLNSTVSSSGGAYWRNRVGALLTIGAMTVGAGCEDAHDLHMNANAGPLIKLKESYSGMEARSGAESILVLAEKQFGPSGASVNEMYDSLGAPPFPASQLVLLSALTGRSIGDLGGSYASLSVDSAAAAANLIALSLAFQRPEQEIQSLFQQARGHRSTASMLTLSTLISGRSIDEVNAIYGQASGHAEDAALLVLAACISKKDIAEVNAIYDSAPGSQLTRARLTYLSALYGEPIQEVTSSYKSAAVSGVPGTMLVEAALVSGREMREINDNYNTLVTNNRNGAASLTLIHALAERSSNDTSLRLLPQITTVMHHHISMDYFLPIITKGESPDLSAGFRLAQQQTIPSRLIR